MNIFVICMYHTCMCICVRNTWAEISYMQFTCYQICIRGQTGFYTLAGALSCFPSTRQQLGSNQSVQQPSLFFIFQLTVLVRQAFGCTVGLSKWCNNHDCKPKMSRLSVSVCFVGFRHRKHFGWWKVGLVALLLVSVPTICNPLNEVI